VIRSTGTAAAIALVVGVLLAGVLAACGDDDGSPGSAADCEQLVGRAATVAARVVADHSGEASTDLDPGTAEDPYPELTRPFAAFEARAEQLGCDRGELRRLACQAYRGIVPTGPAMEEFLDQLTSTCS
jgi:hypothetical protein